ncbi:MAG: carboxylating nicotinate-nucleotide diphosphorylase [Elusimicrobiales bacterium]|nr:carboxylating nicotinate-nucleotide diphosphorylase [Elusimicrobiales bacterium]
MDKIKRIIKNALKEDIGTKDITTEIFTDKKKRFLGVMISKSRGIVCGIDFVKTCFKLLNPKAIIKKIKNDGEIIIEGDKIIEIISDRTILSAERTALNIIQRLSGIATKTKKFVDIAKPYGVEIYDTRKTTPNFRMLEKYAVSCGGGKNHRFDLFDAFMIKDNHISCLKSFYELENKIKKARKLYPNKEIEIEVQSIEQLKKFINLDIDVIMLDNFSPKDAEKAIKIIKEKRKDILIEISGGINEENIKNFLILKPDRISIGSLTHSYNSLDISLEIKSIT